SRRRHTRFSRDWSSDVCSSDLHPGLQAIAELPAALKALPDPDETLLRHALHWIEQRFEREKRVRAEMGFDDMLTRLDAALGREEIGRASCRERVEVWVGDGARR